MIKNYFRILKKPHAYLQTILKTPVKFQKDWTETVGGVKGTKYLLKTRNHAPRATRHVPRATRHAPRTTENQKQCPSTFLRKGGGQKLTRHPAIENRLVQRVVVEDSTGQKWFIRVPITINPGPAEPTYALPLQTV